MKDLLSSLKIGYKLSAVKFRSVDSKYITCYGHFRAFRYKYVLYFCYPLCNYLEKRQEQEAALRFVKRQFVVTNSIIRFVLSQRSREIIDIFISLIFADKLAFMKQYNQLNRLTGTQNVLYLKIYIIV